MNSVAVTGAGGFIGRNLVVRLREMPDVEVVEITRADSRAEARSKLGRVDLVFHLAGANRPERVEEFEEVNAGFTRQVVTDLVEQGRTPPVVYTSSYQAELENDYGRSKRAGEAILERYARDHGAVAVVYRLPHVFGKWSRPHYNSVVATFCHEVARGGAIEIHDPNAPVHLIHVDAVVDRLLGHLDEDRQPGLHRCEAGPVYPITVGELAERVRSYAGARQTLRLPDLRDPLDRLLHSTYLSFLPEDAFSYALEERSDARGRLAEFLKGEALGQVFVSTTEPGARRGGHYHHRKVEKFCVLRGEALIRFRSVDGDRVLRYPVSGERFEVVDIPPGYTHDIENVGDDPMVVLFWANEIFDPTAPDTRTLPVAP